MILCSGLCPYSNRKGRFQSRLHVPPSTLSYSFFLTRESFALSLPFISLSFLLSVSSQFPFFVLPHFSSDICTDQTHGSFEFAPHVHFFPTFSFTRVSPPSPPHFYFLESTLSSDYVRLCFQRQMMNKSTHGERLIFLLMHTRKQRDSFFILMRKRSLFHLMHTC